MYMKSLARVIPTVVSHHFRDMGRLMDSDQIKEEIVAVVDEVRRGSIVKRTLSVLIPNRSPARTRCFTVVLRRFCVACCGLHAGVKSAETLR